MYALILSILIEKTHGDNHSSLYAVTEEFVLGFYQYYRVNQHIYKSISVEAGRDRQSLVRNLWYYTIA